MNFKQYVDEKRDLYQAFADTVQTVIGVVLQSDSSIAQPQQIQTRAKSAGSLARKLKERGLERSRSIEKEIKDLAGVRLIFYSNADERSFLNSRLLNENFHVDYDASKIHHPVGKPGDVNEHYRGLHYVITLKEDRLKLPEYSRFAGLRCEIQIQTILNHAWAETAHDVTYHQPERATGFGTKQFDRINKRMAGIMDKYLVPAGHEFEKVHHDFRKLMAGKTLFDKGVVKTLRVAADNNERHETLEKIRKDVLPLYDDAASVAQELRDAMVDAIHQGRGTATKPIEFAPWYGSLPGRSEADVTQAALDIINDLRYLDIIATFHTILDLFPGAKSDAERQHILDAAKKLSEYNLNVWRQAGSFVQDTLIAEILKLDSAVAAASQPIIQCVCENVLKSEIRGVSSETYNTISLHTGAVAATSKLAETRQQALAVLLERYSQLSEENEKRECYAALSASMMLPNMGQYAEGLWLLVIRDTKTIIEVFLKRGMEEPYGILENLETHCFRVFQNATGVRNTQPQQHQVIAAYDDLLPLIERFRTQINADETYSKFKTFVGYSVVFEEHLEDEDHDWRRRDAIRSARMAGYLEELNETTTDDWLSLLVRFEKEQDATKHVAGFCEQVGEKKPKIALTWLTKPDLPFRIRTAALFGLLKSNERAATIALMQQWIADGIHLEALARVLQYGKDAPEDLLPLLAEKALSISDLGALQSLVQTFIKRGKSLDPSFVERFLLPSIHALAIGKRWYWIMHLFPDAEEQRFLASLTEEQTTRILNDFIALPRIEHDAEAFLKPLAKSHPLAVLNMFRARIQHGEDETDRYDAIPFSLHDLPDALATDPALMIGTVREWYAEDSALFEHRGGRLLALVFPSFSEPFGQALQALLKRDPPSVDFVLSVLQNYRGEPALHETFKVIVNLLKEKDDRLPEIERALESTGVLSGEFGFVEAYQGKRSLAEPWLKDKRPRVRKFAERYIRSLDRAIAAEQRRAEEGIELRKHAFDPDGD